MEREARELNLTSEQFHQQLDILKNSNFLGKDTSDLFLLVSMVFVWSSPSLHHSEVLTHEDVFVSRCIRQHP